MSSLYGLLATTNLYHQIPTYVLIACAVVLLFAFTVGFVKGFRKVAWGGFYWAAAFVGFTLAYKKFAALNPIAAMLKGRLEGAADFAWALLLMIASIAISLIFYGAFSVKYRPKEIRAPKDLDIVVDEYGFVYEDDCEDDSPYQEKPTYVLVGAGKPNIFGRIAGGFMSCMNFGVILASIIAVATLVIGQTKLVDGRLGAIFDVPLARMILSYSSAYALDFFTIGIVIWIAFIGHKTGFVRSFRLVVTTLGILLIGDVGLALPFTKAANFYPIAKLIERCGNLFTQMKPEYRTILAKLTAGGFLAVGGLTLVCIISFLLRKAVDRIEANMATYVIDEILAVVLYLIVGALIVVTFWALLYLLDYCGLFYISDAFGNNESLAREFFEVAEHYLKDFADKSLLRFKVR